MGFGNELQGKASHEALLHLQDAEIQLMETIKRWVTQRVKADRDYAQTLTTMLATARKNENQDLNTPVSVAWNKILEETETMMNKVRGNIDDLCSKTLDKLFLLINEKRTIKKIYLDEKNRLEQEYNKVVDNLQKHKTEYDKMLSKAALDRAKYTDLQAKGKPGSKLEDAKSKYLKTTVKLHKAHNEYIIQINEAKLHQQSYLGTALPGLLDSQQNILENVSQSCKEVLMEYATLTDVTGEDFRRGQQEIYQAISALSPKMEYRSFIESHREDPLSGKELEFEEELLQDYKGTLVSNTLALDDLTLDSLQHSKSQMTENCQIYTTRRENKERDLRETEESLIQLENRSDENDRKEAVILKRKVAVLQREVQELKCHEDKYRSLEDMVSQPLNTLGDDEPPAGLDIQDLSGSESGSKTDIPSGTTSTMGKNLGKFFKRKTEPPPNVPDRDFSKSDEKPQARVQPQPRQKSDKFDYQGVSNSSKTSSYAERCVEDEEWFHGVLPRDEVQRLLVNDGDFLVRESKHKKTGQSQYVLSVQWGGHKHFIIQGKDGAWQFEGPTYATVVELVDQQLASGTAVTSKSQAILKKAILREEWELKNDDVELMDKIGSGNFGDVFRGIYRPKRLEVAVKTCKENLSEDQKKKFLMEGRILKQYDHPNIVRFIGIAAHRNPVMIVMEFVSGGALLNFLRKNGKNQGKRALVQMCEDAAGGMAYLEQSNCIHRDLAARNCLIGKKNVVKISDFGMSREEEEYTVSDGMKQIPIKWTAPEALNYGKYTSMCDVWSYGILMWEVFSSGQTPYPGLTNNQARDKIDMGYRMPAPESTPDEVYTLMKRCWESDPDKRPHFDEIHKALGKCKRRL